MQTFLPYDNYADCAYCLDNKRLGKQRVESKQILIALGHGVGQHRGDIQSRWRSHPAVRMWRGYERELARYSAAICREWRSRGFKDSLLPQFEDLCNSLHGFNVPPWLGRVELHSSHRSNLLRKLHGHYSRFGWSEPSDMPYWWPTDNGL